MTELVQRQHAQHELRQTSIAAYYHPQLALGEMQKQVYDAILQANLRGMEPTDREIAVDLKRSDPNSVRPRRFELMAAGYIAEAGKRICTVTQRSALTWKVVDTQVVL